MDKKDKKDKRDKRDEKEGRKTSRIASWIASAPSSLIAMTPAMDVGTAKGRIVDHPLKDCRIDRETATWIMTLVAVCKGDMTVVASGPAERRAMAVADTK